MKCAHKISKRFNIDPGYSVNKVIPYPHGLSIFSNKTKGPFWLYGWGEVEAYWLSKVRKNGFLECIWVYHPGKFRQFSHTLILKKAFNIKNVPSMCIAEVYHSGDLRFIINGKSVLHIEGSSKPIRRKIDIAPFMKKDENEIFVVLNRIDEPSAFLIDTPIVKSDNTWKASIDFQNWHIPACFPFENKEQFPHQEEIPKLDIEPRAVSGRIYDFGVEVFGYPVINTKNGNSKVRIDAGESIPEINNKRHQSKEQWFSVSALGPGVYTFEEPVACRYLKINTSRDVLIDKLRLDSPLYPTRYRGAFACSDDILTRIWMHSAYTLRLCMREFFIDGIKRDRMPWMLDAYISILCNFYSFAEKEIVKRTLTSLCEENDGTYINGIIDYSLWWVMGIEKYLLYTGDFVFCEILWPKIISLMGRFKTKEDSNGFLISDESTWVFIDWAEIDKKGIIASLQMIYIMALLSASRLADVSNKKEEGLKFKKKARALQEKCRQYFWNARYGAFIDGYYNGKQSKNISRHSNILAILSGVSLKGYIRSILRNVFMSKNIPAVGTPYMKSFELLALSQIKQTEIVLDEIKNYWGGMLSLGATTFWEAYNPEDSGNGHYAFYGRPFGKSLCHAWSAGPIYLLSAELLGIYPLEMGWKRFTITPRLRSLKWMCASIPTPYGNIESEVEGYKVRVKVPKGIVMERTLSDYEVSYG